MVNNHLQWEVYFFSFLAMNLFDTRTSNSPIDDTKKVPGSPVRTILMNKSYQHLYRRRYRTMSKEFILLRSSLMNNVVGQREKS